MIQLKESQKVSEKILEVWQDYPRKLSGASERGPIKRYKGE